MAKLLKIIEIRFDFTMFIENRIFVPIGTRNGQQL